MIRKDGDRQKRSLTTYVGNNRQMLSDIRDSLSHLRKNQQATADSMQIKTTEHPQLAPPLTGDPRTSATAKSSNYRQKALAEIRNQLLPFANEGLSSASSTVSTISSTTTSGISSASGLSSTSGSSSPCQSVEHNGLDKDLSRTVLAAMGYDEDPTLSRALKAGIRTSGGDASSLDALYKLQSESQQNGLPKQVPAGLPGITSKIIRKPSFEGNVRDINLNMHRMSPGLDSGAGSTRSDSPSVTLSIASRSTFDSMSRNGDPMSHLQVCRQYSPNFCGEPPPPPPPRSQGPPPTPPRGTTPPPPIPPSQSDARLAQQAYMPASQQVHQMLKRISPAPQTSRPGQGLGYNSALSQSSTPQRGTSPVSHGRSPIVVQNSLQQQLQISHQLQCALYNGGVSQMEPPPPYPIGSAQTSSAIGSVSLATKIASPPPYTSVATSRQSPTQPLPSSSLEYAAALQQKRSSPTIYPASGPITSVAASVATSSAALKPAPLQAWSPLSPPIMLSVKSTQVQKPVLQTAVAPTAPPSASNASSLPSYTSAVQQKCHAVETPVSPVVGSSNVTGVSSVTSANSYIALSSSTAAVATSYNTGPSIVVQTSIPTTDPPSYASTMQALAAQRGVASTAPSLAIGSNNNHHTNYGVQYSSAAASPAPVMPPTSGTSSAPHETRLRTSPSPPSAGTGVDGTAPSRPSPQHHIAMAQASSGVASLKISTATESYGASHHHQSIQHKFSPITVDSSVSVSCSNSVNSNAPSTASQSPVSFATTAVSQSDTQDSSTSGNNSYTVNTNSNGVVCCNSSGGNNNNGNAASVTDPRQIKMTHQSPIPERKLHSREKEDERCDTKVRNYSPQAFKFYMEQHMENVLKSHQQRLHRRVQLETEMAKVGLSEEAQFQMRKMLHQKESNYIRLKRAKMNKAQFTHIRLIGVGAFGEVALVRKLDTQHLYAMKTLRKADVLKRNQVAHVKAERDILAEADNEWVVKLYYSFQDQENLYFVMDYIPGGDLMSLLIKFGIFQESLARFYIAELVCAVESVHKMGFIHRDIKPDNILIDRDGHIKLTDFGLCTGFRWTHNSKYYQNGEHNRQDSMEPDENWPNKCQCNSSSNLKPLERRRRREHQRCLAHSLVGTPNYIAPEVLMRTGYTHVCDWWSVGVILYEMLVGQPPFLANTPVETQYKVINWETTLKIPRNSLTNDAKDLILKLCCCHDRRLGKNGPSEVKAHAFFDSVDFEGGIRRQPAPYTPSIRHATDTSNFDPVDPDRLRNSDSSDSEDKGMSGYDNGQHPEHAFFEFTFRRFFDDGGHAYPTRLGTDDNDNQGPVYV